MQLINHYVVGMLSMGIHQAVMLMIVGQFGVRVTYFLRLIGAPDLRGQQAGNDRQARKQQKRKFHANAAIEPTRCRVRRQPAQM